MLRNITEKARKCFAKISTPILLFGVKGLMIKPNSYKINIGNMPVKHSLQHVPGKLQAILGHGKKIVDSDQEKMVSA